MPFLWNVISSFSWSVILTYSRAQSIEFQQIESSRYYTTPWDSKATLRQEMNSGMFILWIRYHWLFRGKQKWKRYIQRKRLKSACCNVKINTRYLKNKMWVIQISRYDASKGLIIINHLSLTPSLEANWKLRANGRELGVQWTLFR